MICQTIVLIFVVKGVTILNCASLKCKCYYDMRGIFSFPVWGACMAVLWIGTGKGVGGEA